MFEWQCGCLILSQKFIIRIKKKSECLRFKSLWIRRFNRHTYTPQIHATIQLDSIKYESESGRWLKLQWWYGCIGRSFCCVCQCLNLNVNVKESESEWNKEDYINRITRKCFTENFREKIIKKRPTQIKIKKKCMAKARGWRSGRLPTRKLCAVER